MKGHRGREVCSVASCGGLAHGRGMCGKHYQRWKKHGRTDDPDPPPSVCSLCPAEHYARGWCYNHYQQWHKTGRPTGAIRATPIERFWSKVDRLTSGCWAWQGYVMPNGYGTFAIDGVSKLAHRMAYELLIGPIPENLTIDHLCQNRSCVNPAHLEAVTLAENVRRAHA